MTDIDRELELARNLSGKLRPDIQERISAVVANPTEETWDDAYSVIVFGMTTLWKAVRAVDPTFPDSKPAHGPWPRIPDRATLIEALRYATH